MRKKHLCLLTLIFVFLFSNICYSAETNLMDSADIKRIKGRVYLNIYSMFKDLYEEEKLMFEISPLQHESEYKNNIAMRIGKKDESQVRAVWMYWQDNDPQSISYYVQDYVKTGQELQVEGDPSKIRSILVDLPLIIKNSNGDEIVYVTAEILDEVSNVLNVDKLINEIKSPSNVQQTQPAQPVYEKSFNVNIVINGKKVEFSEGDGLPFVENGRTMVPLRKVGNALNAAIAWRSNDSTIHVLKKGVSLIFKANSSTMIKQYFQFEQEFVYISKPDELKIDATNSDVVPIIYENRTYLPLRAIAETFGAKVDWDASTSTATITLADDSHTDYESTDAARVIESLNYYPPII